MTVAQEGLVVVLTKSLSRTSFPKVRPKPYRQGRGVYPDCKEIVEEDSEWNDIRILPVKAK
jgi:hypothetical protein